MPPIQSPPVQGELRESPPLRKRVGSGAFPRSWAPAIALCALTVTLTASVPGRGPVTWSYASSDHFEVYTTGGEKHAREAIADFEPIYTFFEHFLKLPSSGAPRTRLIVFSTAKEFAPYKANENSDAFWLGTPDGDFIVMSSLGADGLLVAVHEYTHLAISRTGAVYPLWLNEGLAEFYSTMTPWGSQMRLGLELPHAADTLAKAKSLIPLDRLLAINEHSQEDHDPRVTPLFYAESWALTHMLMTAPQYRERTSALLTAMAAGTPAAAALPATYGKSVDAIGEDLRQYLGHFKFASTLVDAPGGGADTHVTPRLADEIEVAVTLASILGWQPGRAGQGLAAMAALEARAPGSLRLAEARGLLEHYSQHCDLARTYLARAVALGSVDPAVLRAYASLIASSAPTEGEALRAKATAIAPDPGGVRVHFEWLPCGGGAPGRH